MMSIMMAGGVYCPLSPRDPEHRLHQLIKQTECHIVFVLTSTYYHFNEGQKIVDIGIIQKDDTIERIKTFDRLSGISVTSESIAYVIFTSGSTGRPKAVCIEL